MTDSFRNSGYARNEKERYFTEPWCTRALVPFIPAYVAERPVWECAAGRGDLAQVLADFGYDVVASDIDLSEYNHDLGSARVEDFLASEPSMEIAESFSAIITNPPYGKEPKEEFESEEDKERRKRTLAEKFVRHALDHGVDYVAMFLRAEFNHAGGRTDLWDRTKYPFAYEIVMTSRPRWDWWLPPPPPGEKKSGPMHNYSWFVWDRQWQGPSTTFFAGKNGPSDKPFKDGRDDE